MEKEPTTKIVSRRITKVVFFLISLVALSSAIARLQSIAKEYTKDISDLNFVANWLPIIAVTFFALGWLTAHLIEAMLLKKQFTIAGILFLVLLLEISIGLWFRSFITYDVLLRFSTAIAPLVLSGAFLRYSVFRDETFLIMQKVG
jgi:hypothetical protein